MESPRITKLIWGADGDLISLRHQASLKSIRASSVIDVQLGFSQPSRRLGMARMLESVPPRMMQGLPMKDHQINYDPRARNMRCLRLPMNDRLACYSMDDLHRIEAILRTQTPPLGLGYARAKRIHDRRVY